MGKQQKQENNKVKADHERLKRALEEIREKRQFVLDTIKDSRFSTILKRYENDIESDKEALVGAEKKAIDGLQARVVARRGLIATLKGSYEAELEESTRQLREFEAQNQLFLAGAKHEESEDAEDAKAAGN